MAEQQPFEDFAQPQPYAMQTDRASIVEKILKSEEVLSAISNFLLGYYKEGDEIKHNIEMQLINENGCRAILFEVGMRISTPAILGTITEQEAKQRAELFEKSMALKLVNNFDAWKMPNTTAMDIIIDTLGDLIFIALTRPISGSTFGGIVDMSQIRQHTLQRDYVPMAEDKPNLFGRLFRRDNS